MSQSSTVTLEDTALQSLRSCRYFLIESMDMTPSAAHAYTQGLASTAMSRVTKRPGTYNLCRLALELGVSDYRELLIDNYRVIYRYWPEDSRVSVYLFAHQRQDFKQLLFEYQLLY